ncbi:hypothetical protein [Nostoc sp.]
MPILGTAVPYPIFLLQIRRQQYKSAFWWMLLWGVLQSIAVIVATAMSTTGYAYAPETAAKVILHSFGCQNFLVGLDRLLCDRIPAKIF